MVRLVDPTSSMSNFSSFPEFLPGKIHVRYFADNGRRSYTLAKTLLPYLGAAELEQREANFAKNYKNLPDAIAEANLYLKMPIDQRVAHFEAEIQRKFEERQARKRETEKARRLLKQIKRPTTPESPAFEDFRIDVDRTNLAQDLEDSLLTAKKRKRQDSTDETRTKRIKAEELTPEERLKRDYLTVNFEPTFLYPGPMKRECVCRICFKTAGVEGE